MGVRLDPGQMDGKVQRLGVTEEESVCEKKIQVHVP
jgi:hypothetical protein